MLFYDCPEHVMQARLLKRGETSGRSDDASDVIQKRFATYVKETLPVIQHFAALGRVHHIVADKPVDGVYAETRAAVEPLVAREVVAHTQAMLDAVHAGRWDTYAALSAGDVTALEAESRFALVRGLPFHRYYFDLAAAAGAGAGGAAPAAASTIANADVRLLSPTSAVIAFDRLVQKPDGSTAAYGETRVWQLQRGGRWRQVHFHRTAQPKA